MTRRLKLTLACAVVFALLVGLVAGMAIGRPAFLPPSLEDSGYSGWARYDPTEKAFVYDLNLNVTHASPNYQVAVHFPKYLLRDKQPDSFDVLLLVPPGEIAQAEVAVTDSGRLNATFQQNLGRTPPLPAKQTPPQISMPAQSVDDELLNSANCLFLATPILGGGEDQKNFTAQLQASFLKSSTGEMPSDAVVVSPAVISWGGSETIFVPRGRTERKAILTLSAFDQVDKQRPVGVVSQGLTCPAA